MEIVIANLAPIFAASIAVIFGLFLWSSDDLKDGIVDNAVAASSMCILLGIGIGLMTGQWWCLLIGAVEPSLVYVVLHMLYKRINRA